MPGKYLLKLYFTLLAFTDDIQKIPIAHCMFRARSGSPHAGERAEALLRRMEDLSTVDKYDVRPDTITFNTCIKAWCNSNRPDAPFKAEEVLSALEKIPQYSKRSGGKEMRRLSLFMLTFCIDIMTSEIFHRSQLL